MRTSPRSALVGSATSRTLHFGIQVNRRPPMIASKFFKTNIWLVGTRHAPLHGGETACRLLSSSLQGQPEGLGLNARRAPACVVSVNSSPFRSIWQAQAPERVGIFTDQGPKHRCLGGRAGASYHLPSQSPLQRAGGRQGRGGGGSQGGVG